MFINSYIPQEVVQQKPSGPIIRGFPRQGPGPITLLPTGVSYKNLRVSPTGVRASYPPRLEFLAYIRLVVRLSCSLSRR